MGRVGINPLLANSSMNRFFSRTGIAGALDLIAPVAAVAGFFVTKNQPREHRIQPSAISVFLQV
jgi:hypothetical protein